MAPTTSSTTPRSTTRARGQRYDWILDTDSHHSLFSVRRALRPKGTYVTLGGTSVPILAALLLGPLISLAGSRSMGLLLWWKPFNPDDVAMIETLIADGKVKPAIDRRFPLSDVVGALRWVNDGHAKGKVIITMSGEPPTDPTSGSASASSGALARATGPG